MTPRPFTGSAKAKCSLVIVIATQEAQHRFLRDLRRCAFPVLTTFDQKRGACVGRVVEERVIAKTLARGMPGIDDDVLRHADAPREFDAFPLAACHRERRAWIGH